MTARVRPRIHPYSKSIRPASKPPAIMSGENSRSFAKKYQAEKIAVTASSGNATDRFQSEADAKLRRQINRHNTAAETNRAATASDPNQNDNRFSSTGVI